MSKRRISSHKVNDIAECRISILSDLSKKAVVSGRQDRARGYISLARRISQKTRTSMPEDLMFCKNCNLPLIPGVNCRIRVGSHRVKTTCIECNGIRRMPYIREQRE